MNTNNNKINKEVEETLASLDEIDKVEANPFLFTRIMQKMQVEEPKPFVQLMVPYALIAMLIVVNALTIFQIINTDVQQNRAAYIDELVEEYALNDDEDASDFYLGY